MLTAQSISQLRRMTWPAQALGKLTNEASASSEAFVSCEQVLAWHAERRSFNSCTILHTNMRMPPAHASEAVAGATTRALEVSKEVINPFRPASPFAVSEETASNKALCKCSPVLTECAGAFQAFSNPQVCTHDHAQAASQDPGWFCDMGTRKELYSTRAGRNASASSALPDLASIHA